jgi:hypothetical protein
MANGKPANLGIKNGILKYPKSEAEKNEYLDSEVRKKKRF